MGQLDGGGYAIAQFTNNATLSFMYVPNRMAWYFSGEYPGVFPLQPLQMHRLFQNQKLERARGR